MRSGLLSFAFLWLVLLRGDGAAELVGRKGKIQGESFVNLRSGPDLNSPSKTILRKGEEVVVEREEGSWYLLSLADGTRGYVHKTLVVFVGNEEAKRAVKNEDIKKVPGKEESVRDLGREEKNNSPALPPLGKNSESIKGKPLPVIKVLEGKEWEILWWFGAVLCIFVIGWICGGNYYLRRDRIRRSKLHF